MQKTDKEILAEVMRIEFSVRKILSGVTLGLKNSTFKGHGMTFADIRSYEPGDDIRNFAWQIMAKTGEPFVKQFEEERDLEVHVAIDVGESLNFGGLKKSKALIQAYVLAFLGLSTVKSKDKFGGVIFSNSQIKRSPALRGDDSVRRFLYSYLEEFKNRKLGQTSEPNIALEYFSKLKTKNSLCVLISDFAKPFDRKLLAKVKSRHNVKIIFIFDPYEKDFPDFGFFPTKIKTGLSWVRGGGKINKTLEKEFSDKVNLIEKIIKTYGVSFVKQSTHDDELRDLTKELKLRSVYG